MTLRSLLIAVGLAFPMIVILLLAYSVPDDPSTPTPHKTPADPEPMRQSGVPETLPATKAKPNPEPRSPEEPLPQEIPAPTEADPREP